VPAHSEEAFYLFVKANFNAEPGRHAFTADINLDGERSRLDFEAYVTEPARSEYSFLDRINLPVLLILLIVLVLVIGIIVGMRTYLRKEDTFWK
jgi:hypothetical protein